MRTKTNVITPVEDFSRMIIPLLFALIAGIIISVLPKLIGAQDQNGEHALVVSPPTQEVIVDPGKTVEVTAKIRNNSQGTLPFRVRIDNFIASGDEGQVALTEESTYAISSWTSIKPETFTLEPGKSQEVTATVQVPANAAGGRYGAFVFGVESGNTNPNAAALTQEIASLFLVRVNGPVDEKLSLSQFTAPGFSEFGPVNLTATFTNSGNVHMRPRGTIAIKDMFGRSVGFVNMASTNIFPGSTRNIPLTWDRKFMVGRYTAVGEFKTGGVSNDNLTGTVSFIVFPVRLAIILVIVLFILYLVRDRLGRAIKALMGN